jgi:MOSC domain-containing protein YiiM
VGPRAGAGSGGSIERITIDPEQMTIRQAVRLAFYEQDNLTMLERVLRIQALSQEWRRMFQEQLTAVTSGTR